MEVYGLLELKPMATRVQRVGALYLEMYCPQFLNYSGSSKISFESKSVFKLEKLKEPATAQIEASIIKNAGSTNVVKQASLEAPIPSKLLPVSIADNIEKNFAKPKI